MTDLNVRTMDVADINWGLPNLGWLVNTEASLGATGINGETELLIGRENMVGGALDTYHIALMGKGNLYLTNGGASGMERLHLNGRAHTGYRHEVLIGTPRNGKVGMSTNSLGKLLILHGSSDTLPKHLAYVGVPLQEYMAKEFH